MRLLTAKPGEEVRKATMHCKLMTMLHLQATSTEALFTSILAPNHEQYKPANENGQADQRIFSIFLNEDCIAASYHGHFCFFFRTKT